MKGVKGSSVSYSYLFITDSVKPDEKKKIVFPSNYSSLLKSVNYLYKDKFIIRSIYTSDGDLVRSTNDIRPGMLLYVSSKEPRPLEEDESNSKSVSLYSPDKDSVNQLSQKETTFNPNNKMSKERKQTYNHLFGLTSQNNNQTKSKPLKQIKKDSNSNASKRNDKSNAAPKSQLNMNNESKEKLYGEATYENNPIRSKVQKEKSVDSFSSANEKYNKPKKNFKNANNNENNINNNDSNYANSNKNGNNNKNSHINNSNSSFNQQVVNQVPPNLYSNLNNANQDGSERWPNEESLDKKFQDTNTEIDDQDNYFENTDNASIDDNLYYNNKNNDRYYYVSTSETRDGDTYFKNDNNDENEANLCKIATELMNENSFARNIKESLKLLDDDVQSKFLRTGQTLELNQRNYWYLRYLQYLKEQKIAQHGNYMFAYDSMVQYIRDYIAKHRFIVYPISNLNRNQKQNVKGNKSNININDDSSIATISTAETAETNVTEATAATNATANCNSVLNCDQIHYWIRSKSAICGPRKSGKSTLLSMMAEHIITESAINGSWKKTVFYMLDMEECGPLLEDFKSLYIFFIEFSLKAIVLVKPELTPHYSMLIKFFASVFEYSNAPKLKKIFSSKPQFQKFALNCENLMLYFSQMWNNSDSHFLFYTNIFQIPSLLALAAGIDNVFIFVDNIEYINTTVQDDLESGQEFNVYEAFLLLLERVNYIIACEEQQEMFDTLDSKTEIISTFQLNAQTQYENNQLIIEYEFDETENSYKQKKNRDGNEVRITRPQKMTLSVAYCGGIPAFVSLWEEINAVADDIDEATEKENKNKSNEEEDEYDYEKLNENNEIDELNDVLISLVQHFVNDMVVDNEREAKIKVMSVRRSTK